MNPRDVYYALMDQVGSNPDLALLAYAVFERDRYAWMEAKERETGEHVTKDKLSEWISAFNQDHALREAREILDWRKPLAEQRASINRIAEALTHIPHWSQDLWIGFVAGMASNFGFVLLILVCAMIYAKDPSPFHVVQEILAK